jgi:FtsH-binding integral membrane protein
MKWLRYAFSALGFTFQYIIPLILFSNVIPYTQEGIAEGLTGMGYIAIGVLVVILIKKLKEKLLNRPKSLSRGLILSIFPIGIWFIINFALEWVNGFLVSMTLYWDKIIIFICIGRLFYTLEEALHDRKEAK